VGLSEEARREQTRRRLIESAGQIFAEQGFQNATVREICDRAGTNIAAINYHFRDKVGLYREVFRTSCLAEKPAIPENLTPEQELATVVQRHLRGILSIERPSLWRQLMTREMAQPSPAFAQVVEEAIRPNEIRLRQVVGKLIDEPPDAPETRLCAHSVIAQCLHYLHARPVLAHIWPESVHFGPDDVDRIADHITKFSLAAMSGLKRNKSQPSPAIRSGPNARKRRSQPRRTNRRGTASDDNH
jgi:AcrR family transcriptional regulator